MPLDPLRERGYAETLRRLSSAQKAPAAGSPAYSRLVNRRLGRYLAALAYQLRLTPNQVTAVSALFSLAGIVLVATVEPSWSMAIAVALALALGYALDSADGQLARLRGGGSKSGEWLDHMVDCAKIVALHGAVLVSFYRFFDLLDSPTLLLIPLGFLLVETVSFFGMTLNDQLKHAYYASRGTRPPAVGRPSTVRSILVLPTDYGVLCLTFLLLGAEGAFVTGYTLLFVANALFIVAASVKWFRDMSALDAASHRPDERDGPRAVGSHRTLG